MDPWNDEPAEENTRRWSLAAIFSLVTSLFCFPVSVLLGVLALVHLHRDPSLRGRRLAFVGIGLGAVMLLFWLPALAFVPWGLKLRAEQKLQHECTSTLADAYVLETTREGGYTSEVEQLGIGRQPHQRYAYFIGSPVELEGPHANVSLPDPDVPLDVVTDEKAYTALGLSPGWTARGFTLICVGNVDEDETLDVWSISDQPRPGIGAGDVHNDVNDLWD